MIQAADPFDWLVPLMRPGVLETFGLYLVRSSALVLVAPLLGTRTGLTAFRVALIVVLASVAFAASGARAELALGAMEPPVYALLAARELVIGLFMGMIVQLGILSMRVAGDAIGTEMGMQMAAQADPDNGASMPLVARFYEELFLLALFSVGAHLWLVRGLVDSYVSAPVGKLELSGSLGTALLAQLGQAVAAGLSVAAPVLVTMGMLTMSIGLMARTVPQVNVLDMSFNLRVSCGLGCLILFLPALEPGLARAMGHLQSALSDGLVQLAGMGGGRG